MINKQHEDEINFYADLVRSQQIRDKQEEINEAVSDLAARMRLKENPLTFSYSGLEVLEADNKIGSGVILKTPSINKELKGGLKL